MTTNTLDPIRGSNCALKLARSQVQSNRAGEPGPAQRGHGRSIHAQVTPKVQAQGADSRRRSQSAMASWQAAEAGTVPEGKRRIENG